jgi:hypothetical protein
MYGTLTRFNKILDEISKTVKNRQICKKEESKTHLAAAFGCCPFFAALLLLPKVFGDFEIALLSFSASV